MSDRDTRGAPLHSSGAPAQPPSQERCSLCGRADPRVVPYRLLSRVVQLPEKSESFSLEKIPEPIAGTEFKAEDFTVCRRCHNRKMIFLVLSMALLAGWIWLAIESKGPGLPMLGFFALFVFMFSFNPFLPVQRLARHIRRARRAEAAAAHPGLRFRVEVLTEGALAIRSQAPSFDRLVKHCGTCGKEVPSSSKVGDHCPHCGRRWGWEKEKEQQ